MNRGQVLRAPPVVVLRLSPAQARAAAAYLGWGMFYRPDLGPEQRGDKAFRERAEKVAGMIRNKLRGKNP